MSKITILMALHNKDDALGNVLFSISRQKTNHDYSFCFLDDMSKNNPLPLIHSFFDKKDVAYKRRPTGGFQFIPRLMAQMVPEDAEYVVYQSSDVVWYDPSLMHKMVDALEKNEKSIVIPDLDNFEINPGIYKDPENFYKNILIAKGNLDGWGDVKSPRYLYLCAMRKDDFLNMSDVRNNESFACDIILRDRIDSDNYEFILIPKPCAIHQRHENIVYQCTSADQCSLSCVQKEWAAKKVNFPFSMGTYNYHRRKYIK